MARCAQRGIHNSCPASKNIRQNTSRRPYVVVCTLPHSCSLCLSRFAARSCTLQRAEAVAKNCCCFVVAGSDNSSAAAFIFYVPRSRHPRSRSRVLSYTYFCLCCVCVLLVLRLCFAFYFVVARACRLCSRSLYLA